MGMFSEAVQVWSSADGRPERLRWKGTDYRFASEPVRWFERRPWWRDEGRAPVGYGPGLVDHEIWQVQAVPEGASPEAAQEPVTLEIVRYGATGVWRLLRVHRGEAMSRRLA
nr:DUF6504 family protein [Sinomonas mesophila]